MSVDLSAAMQVPDALSIAGSFLVVLSYLCIKKLWYLRHVELVFYVAVNDLIASIGVALGAVKSGTSACWFQGLSTNYNYLSSVFWSVVIVYQIYTVIIFGRAIRNLTYFHLFCWGFPLFLTLIPLTTNTYGLADDDGVWCFIANRPNSPPWGIIVWQIVCFYIWIWLSVLVIIYLFGAVAWRIQSSALASLLIDETLYRLALYPVIFIACWTVDSINDIGASVSGGYGNRYSAFNVAADVVPALQGFLLSLIFFIGNEMIWHEWQNLLQSIFLNGSDDSTNKIDEDLLSKVPNMSCRDGSIFSVDPRYTIGNNTVLSGYVSDGRTSFISNSSRQSQQSADKNNA